MKQIHKFLSLPAAKRRLLISAALLLWIVKLGLALFPFQMLRRFLDKMVEMHVGVHKAGRCSAEEIVWAVELAGRLMPQARTCLTQALTAQVLLLRRGYPARLHIGVVKEDGGQFLAHAWVKSGSEVVIGGHELERYTPLVRLEGKRHEFYT